MKGGGVRFESQRFRLLTIVVGCFLISITFLLSSRPEAAAFDTLSPKAWLEEARTPAPKKPAAIKTVVAAKSSSSSPAASLGRDFLVDITPQQQGDQSGASHGDGHGSSTGGEKTTESTEWVKDTVIIQEVRGSSGGERAEPQEKRDRNAAAGAQDEAAAEEAVVRDDAVRSTTTTQTDVQPAGQEEVTPVGGRRMKLQGAAAEAVTTTEEQQTPASSETTARAADHHELQLQPLPPLCDFSDQRSDVCDFTGDIRMDANTSSFILVVGQGTSPQSHKVRPYPRKGDETCMGRVTEINVRTTTTASSPPPLCTQTHDAPAVTFSIGGYTGNIFHDFSDVIVPLFNTVHKYAGDVQLVMANVAPWWLIKYDKLLRSISRYAPLDLAAAGTRGEVHCFRHAVVSLRAHRELIIEKDRSLDGLATPDFTRFLRSALSLPRDAPTNIADGSGRKPRLLIISRHRTRILLNLAAVVLAAEEAGFEAVVNESDVANDISEVGRLINSADVLVGVHGAGLTNMMFLPPGATMVQVVPWGGLQWIARMDYGDPAEAMGLRYVQYEITVDESSLKEKYPRDHEIFTNPTGLHKKGFGFMRQTLMDGQNITVDVARFKGVLQEALGNYLAQS